MTSSQSPDVIVIVDVLSFTTSVDIATSCGAAVLPYRWKDESAVAYAEQHDAELAAHRDDANARYTLAPSSLEHAPAGLRLVLPSPNGSSLSFDAMATGANVVAGCLRNARAVAEWISRTAQNVTVVPAGERWPDDTLRPAIEDLIGAGAIVHHLKGRCSPEAEIAAAAFESVRNTLHETLHRSLSGQELMERGFRRDVELAAELNASDHVPFLRHRAFMSFAEH